MAFSLGTLQVKIAVKHVIFLLIRGHEGISLIWFFKGGGGGALILAESMTAF